MNKSTLLACALCVFSLGSMAQTTPATQGAKLVAERDAAYAQAHPSSKVVKATSAKRVVHTQHKTKAVASPKDVKPTPAK